MKASTTANRHSVVQENIDLAIIVALPCEAKALIESFALEPVAKANASRPDLFLSAETKPHSPKIALQISGIGKFSSAAAVGSINARFEQSSSFAWLNLGIAGHASLAIGDLVYANKISERGSGTHYYPQLCFKPECRSSNIITVDEVETKFRLDAAYEMEAAGFFAAASRQSSAELIHCLKIISDGPREHKQATPKISASFVEELISAQLPTVENYVMRLCSLLAAQRDQESKPENWDTWLQRWHFTQSQRHQLERLLIRCEVLIEDNNQGELLLHICSPCNNSRSVIHRLQRIIDEALQTSARELPGPNLARSEP